MAFSPNHPIRLVTMLTLLALLCGCNETAAYKETRAQTLEHMPDTAVRVKTANGAIAINQSDRHDVEIVNRVEFGRDTSAH